MSNPSYPAELPPPMRQGFQVQRGDGRTITRQDAGPPNIRRRFSSVVDTIAFTTQLSRAQLARFDRFYEEDTKGGSLPFRMSDPMTDGWSLLIEDGAPLRTGAGVRLLVAKKWLVTFGQSLPATTVRGVTFTVTFQLWVLPS